MSDKTKIEWTDATWNPVTGCTKVSPGCDHCYAERVTERFNGPGSFAEVKLHPDRLDQPLRWRKPRKVFVNSMSDLFHDDVPDEYIAKVFAVMAGAPRHTFQILTKRHGRMRSLLSGDFRDQVAEQITDMIARGLGRPDIVFDGECAEGGNLWGPRNWPLPNVWLGVSVEDQKWADIRIPALLDTPAAVRFLSCEPLLGPIDLDQSLSRHTLGLHLDECLLCCVDWSIHVGYNTECHGQRILDWVIVGGESGPGARPMHPDWARSLRDQCTAAGVPFLFKQWGEFAMLPGLGHDHGNLPAAAVTQRVGKKAAGRELDGRTWDEYPEAAA